MTGCCLAMRPSLQRGCRMAPSCHEHPFGVASPPPATTRSPPSATCHRLDLRAAWFPTAAPSSIANIRKQSRENAFEEPLVDLGPAPSAVPAAAPTRPSTPTDGWRICWCARCSSACCRRPLASPLARYVMRSVARLVRSGGKRWLLFASCLRRDWLLYAGMRQAHRLRPSATPALARVPRRRFRRWLGRPTAPSSKRVESRAKTPSAQFPALTQRRCGSAATASAHAAEPGLGKSANAALREAGRRIAAAAQQRPAAGVEAGPVDQQLKKRSIASGENAWRSRLNRCCSSSHFHRADMALEGLSRAYRPGSALGRS